MIFYVSHERKMSLINNKIYVHDEGKMSDIYILRFSDKLDDKVKKFSSLGTLSTLKFLLSQLEVESCYFA